MKFVKYFILSLFCLFIFVAIYLATLDGTYEISRSRNIPADPTVVFNDLNDFKNWEQWGPWHEQDSTIQVSYGEQTIGEGAYYSWTSQDGDGEMTMLQVESPKRLNQKMTFLSAFGDMSSEVYWILEEIEEGTKLTWGIKGSLPFVMRFMTAGMEDHMGPMEERGLELFQENIERKLRVFSIENKGVVDYSGGFYLYQSTSSRIDEIGDQYQFMKTELDEYLERHQIRASGSPFTIYHKFDQENGSAMYSVGYPISERVITEKGSRVLSAFMKRGEYFKTVLTGDHSNSEKAWIEAMKNAENLDNHIPDPNGEPFEVFVNSLDETHNPAELVTEIYIPVSGK